MLFHLQLILWATHTSIVSDVYNIKCMCIKIIRPISYIIWQHTSIYDSCEFVKMQIGSTCNVSARCWYEQTSECEPVARKVHA